MSIINVPKTIYVIVRFYLKAWFLLCFLAGIKTTLHKPKMVVRIFWNKWWANPFIHSLYITFAVFSRTWNPYLSLILRVKRKPDWKTRSLTWREMFFQVVICLHIITFMFYLLGLKFLHNIWPFHKLAF